MSVSAKPNKRSGPTTTPHPPQPHRPLGSWASSRVCFPRLSLSRWKPPTCQPHVHFSRWAGTASRCSLWGPCALGRGATKQNSRFGWGSGTTSWWAPVMVRELSVRRFAGLSPWPGPLGTWRETRLGPEGTREPGGSRSSTREPLGLGSGSGSPRCGSLPREDPPHLSGHGGRRRGPGQPETCLTLQGGMRAGSKAAS